MSTFGKYLRVTTYGESHSKSVGVIIDNFPPNFKFLESEVQSYMDRRRPG
jgi:chorismate synthase